MAQDKQGFNADTEASLRACARWLDENASRLAGEFVGGCLRWSVEFSAGDDGMFPEIDISVRKIDRDMIDFIMSSPKMVSERHRMSYGGEEC